MLKFKKIASALASTLMVSSTVALAAAANYPSPFVQNGMADVAVVYGSHSAATADLVGVLNIQDSLNSYVVSGETDGETTITGEAYPLFTSGSPLLLNSTINTVKTTLTDAELPTILADGTFETTSSTGYTQRINVGSHPKIDFAQQPSDDEDPQVGIALGTSPQTQSIYNATIIFDSAVNFTHADSVGEDLDLFGQRFTVGGATTTTKLVLLKSSQTVSLTDAQPSSTVTVEGNTYTVELMFTDDTTANIKVTDSSGNSDTKDVSEENSKTIQGLEVAVESTNEADGGGFTTNLLVGSSKITLQDGSAVKVGTDDDTIDGTNVEFELTNGTQTTSTGNIGKIIFQAAAEDSQNDGIVPSQSFVDPVFGSFKVDFTGLTVPIDSSDREEISVANSGSDKMSVTFMSHDGSEAESVYYIYNKTTSLGSYVNGSSVVSGAANLTLVMDLADNDGDAIVVSENEWVNESGYVVLASDDEGGLYEITTLSNSSSATASDDELTLRNVLTGEEETYEASSEGSGSFTLQGRSFDYVYDGAATISNSRAMRVRFNAPESAGAQKILFPTVATGKGAKIAFYEPTTVTLTGTGTANLRNAAGENVTSIAFQDGDGYTSHAINGIGVTNVSNFTITCSGGSAVAISDGAVGSTSCTTGVLTYNFTTARNGQTTVYLVSPEGGNIIRPALIVFEEKDDASNYNAIIATTDGGYDGADVGVGVADLVRTWGTDSGGLGNEIQLESDTDVYQDMDLFGALMTLDQSDSDQKTGTISYPDEQVEALVYIAEESAAISGGSSSSGDGMTVGVPITDLEISDVSGKNIIVVGGSCVNTVAAELLGSSSPLCGADFTSVTSIGSGEFLIETFDRGDGTIATLVAGYDASDTSNAATYLTTQTVDTTEGMKYVGTTSTSAELVTSEA